MHYLFSVSVVTPRGRKEKTRSKQKQQLAVKGEMASINSVYSAIAIYMLKL